ILLVNERMRVPADLRKSLRQEWYYVCKFGIWEHAQRKGEKPEQAIRRLNGQANYQRWVDPQDKSLGEICKGISAIQKDLINPTFGG
ncbi:hypothetical protein, partial [Caulobacter sp. B11]|uniref:hypothetical protein n=1 Tax=Caulobacter sp. B11 TaxID=2048899 RepID=UPI001F435210